MLIVPPQTFKASTYNAILCVSTKRAFRYSDRSSRSSPPALACRRYTSLSISQDIVNLILNRESSRPHLGHTMSIAQILHSAKTHDLASGHHDDDDSIVAVNQCCRTGSFIPAPIDSFPECFTRGLDCEIIILYSKSSGASDLRWSRSLVIVGPQFNGYPV